MTAAPVNSHHFKARDEIQKLLSARQAALHCAVIVREVLTRS
jgi:hypothetical protein